MPVKKFRSLEEMEADLWHEPGDPALFRAMRFTWDFGRRTIRPAFPPGVYKHRSLEDLEAQTERWEAANFSAFQRRRARAEGGT